METPEEGVGAVGAGTAKYRAGNDAVFPLLQLARQQIVQTGAQRRFDQPRRLHLRLLPQCYYRNEQTDRAAFLLCFFG